MTQEEKNILIKELCMRIPYGVKCNINGELCKVTRVDVECQQVYLKKDDEHGGTYSIARGDVVKPYLRPLETITKEERIELGKEIQKNKITPYGEIKDEGIDNLLLCTIRQSTYFQEWLLSKHFDFRGLIKKGLALAAPEGMYN